MELRRIDASPQTPAPAFKNKDEFELAFRRYCDDGGHSYDHWDIEYGWKQYTFHPEQFTYLKGN